MRGSVFFRDLINQELGLSSALSGCHAMINSDSVCGYAKFKKSQLQLDSIWYVERLVTVWQVCQVFC